MLSITTWHGYSTESRKSNNFACLHETSTTLPLICQGSTLLHCVEQQVDKVGFECWLQGADQPSTAVLRDQTNVTPAHTSSSHAPLSKTVQKPITAGQAKPRPAPVNTIAMQALAKQKLKRLSAWFAAWRALAKEAKMELLGASSMLKWRKLLRIWKV